MTRTANREEYQKTEETDADQSVEDRLHADAIDNVDEQAEAEEESDCL
jgi:hypothetical protein